MKTFLLVTFLFLSFLAEADQPAPAFSLKTIDGTDFNLADSTGKIVYLDFWASWCGPCKLSFPDMSKIHKEFSDEGVVVVAVSVDTDVKKAAKFIGRYPIDFIVLSDETGEVAAAYDLPTMPTTYLIDESGQIKYVHSGYRPGDLEILRQQIRRMLDVKG